jgi:transcriptional regulator with XRE-family HTH domain
MTYSCIDSIGATVPPFSGLHKSEKGLIRPYHIRVGRRRSPRTAIDPVHEILRENILARLPVVFPSISTETGQLEALGKRIHHSPETIRRMLAGISSPRLTTLAQIAHGLDMTVSSLLSAPTALPRQLQADTPRPRPHEPDSLHRRPR